MNHDSDTEMDLLLQRHARRRNALGMAGAVDDNASAKMNAVQGSAKHMDADELSAYAEGALPERTRSRYAAHLADCGACRGIVTRLVISSSVEAEESGQVAQTVPAPGRSWLEWFAALFSPPVLRYALPALALTVVIAIVLIVATRKREEPSFVAQNGPSKGETANTSVEDQKNGAVSSNAAPESPGAPSSAASNTDAARAGAVQQQQQETNGTTSSPPLDGTSPASPSKPAEVAANEPQPSKVDERAAENKQSTQSLPGVSPVDRTEDRAKEKDEEVAAQKRRETDEAATGGAPATTASGRANRNTEPANNSALSAASESAGGARGNSTAKSAPAPAMRARRDTSGDDQSAAETRSVAGKRFRLQNGIWIDTAYNSSRPLVRVRRGTEQYRALVADEPVIATVANELGDCIVVVKGRAYQIQ